jgi:hypothetical protein
LWDTERKGQTARACIVYLITEESREVRRRAVATHRLNIQLIGYRNYTELLCTQRRYRVCESRLPETLTPLNVKTSL